MTTEPRPMSNSATRPGEIELPGDPAQMPGDAHLVFIGRVRTSWDEANPPPKNPREARDRGIPARLEIDAPYRAALLGLSDYSHIIVLAWLHQARRDLAVIQPPHAATPRGVFALRSPVRPNPIGLTVCRLLAIDEQTGRIDIGAIDFLDRTPLLDVKPYRPGIDAIPDAVVA